LHLHGSRAVVAAVMARCAAALRSLSPRFHPPAFSTASSIGAGRGAWPTSPPPRPRRKRRQACAKWTEGSASSIAAGDGYCVSSPSRSGDRFPRLGPAAEIEARVAAETAGLADELDHHLATAIVASGCADGIAVAIVGPPKTPVNRASSIKLARREAANHFADSPARRATSSRWRSTSPATRCTGGSAGLRDSADAI